MTRTNGPRRQPGLPRGPQRGADQNAAPRPLKSGLAQFLSSSSNISKTLETLQPLATGTADLPTVMDALESTIKRCQDPQGFLKTIKADPSYSAAITALDEESQARLDTLVTNTQIQNDERMAKALDIIQITDGWEATNGLDLSAALDKLNTNLEGVEPLYTAAKSQDTRQPRARRPITDSSTASETRHPSRAELRDRPSVGGAEITGEVTNEHDASIKFTKFYAAGNDLQCGMNSIATHVYLSDQESRQNIYERLNIPEVFTTELERMHEAQEFRTYQLNLAAAIRQNSIDNDVVQHEVEHFMEGMLRTQLAENGIAANEAVLNVVSPYVKGQATLTQTCDAMLAAERQTIIQTIRTVRVGRLSVEEASQALGKEEDQIQQVMTKVADGITNLEGACEPLLTARPILTALLPNVKTQYEEGAIVARGGGIVDTRDYNADALRAVIENLGLQLQLNPQRVRPEDLDLGNNRVVYLYNPRGGHWECMQPS